MWDEDKHPRDNSGKFTDKRGSTGYSKEQLSRAKEKFKAILNDKITPAKKTMSPSEKIASVHIQLDRDNILPELGEESLQVIGLSENKPVLVKASTIKRNLEEHGDVMPEEFDRLISEPLYSPEHIFKANDNKPYYSFAKPMKVSNKNGEIIYGLALLDVDNNKDNFEVVHWHWVKSRKFGKMINK